MAAETCGVAGYDNSGHDCDPSQPAYNVDTKATTSQLCSALCKKPTENNFTPERSPYFFYDVRCEITSSSPPHVQSRPKKGRKSIYPIIPMNRLILEVEKVAKMMGAVK
ncbi:hypothetical protein MBLNU13_g06000t2 [Cladosporium sp. NU13]